MPKPRAAKIPTFEQAAKITVARRAKRSAAPGSVQLTLALDLPRDLAEPPSARATRKGKNLAAVVIEMPGDAGTK